MLRVQAKVSFLSTEEGGISSSLLGAVPCRPNHNFGDSNNRYMYIGQINFEKDDIVMPGDV